MGIISHTTKNAQYIFRIITYPYNWTALLASAINRNTEGGILHRHKNTSTVYTVFKTKF